DGCGHGRSSGPGPGLREEALHVRVAGIARAEDDVVADGPAPAEGSADVPGPDDSNSHPTVLAHGPHPVQCALPFVMGAAIPGESAPDVRCCPVVSALR